MKIIFLDIDGVLNSQQFAREVGWGGFFTEEDVVSWDNVKWVPENVDLLKQIVEKTSAEIVIHSTWACSFSVNKFKEMFELYNYPDIPIRALTNNKISRSERIMNYIKEHNITNYIIIDDLNKRYFDIALHERLISTDMETGITKYEVNKAIDLLNN